MYLSRQREREISTRQNDYGYGSSFAEVSKTITGQLQKIKTEFLLLTAIVPGVSFVR